MDAVVRDDTTAEIPVQKQNHRAVKLRVVPQFQKRGGFGVMLQTAGIGQVF